MIDLSKYVGKSHSEYDCYGLFRAIQAELGYDLPSFEPDQDRRSAKKKVDVELLARYKRLDVPEMYCGVVMYNCGVPSHIACYIGEGKIIHSTKSRGVTIDDLDMRDVEGFYGVRK